MTWWKLPIEKMNDSENLQVEEHKTENDKVAFPKNKNKNHINDNNF